MSYEIDHTNERGFDAINWNKSKKIVIDITPTWFGILPILIQGIKNGSPNVLFELEKMAMAADNYNKLVREQK